jgi:hypothetical protein
MQDSGITLLSLIMLISKLIFVKQKKAVAITPEAVSKTPHLKDLPLKMTGFSGPCN